LSGVLSLLRALRSIVVVPKFIVHDPMGDLTHS
jgi:hypothetical protein